jgi:carbonic anhydrase
MGLTPANGAEFGYTAKGGTIPPVDWGEISQTCQAGNSQSPIAISTLLADPSSGLEAPAIHYGTSNLIVFNNGHTIEAEVEEGTAEIEIDGTVYDLIQFHIHWASEHFIDGELYPAELHLVHRDHEGHLAVLGSLLRYGNKNSKLNPFFQAATKLPHADDETEVHDFDLNRLVPEHATGFYHYSGSLTTPPCSEGVSWWVWDATRTVSRAQLDNIRIGVPRDHNPQGNRRPVQGLNGRDLYWVSN